jgi:hypothetical protein
MQIGLINSIASWWFNKRLSDLRLFIKNPVNTQEEQLRLLIDSAKNTHFGRLYGFEKSIQLKLIKIKFRYTTTAIYFLIFKK